MRDSASVHLTKIAAAQRQLDAAIRMVFQNEDELAVHTLAAAAYRILRDLKKKRGRSDLCDSLNRGIFYLARDLATGKLHELPEEILASESLAVEVRAVAAAIRRGDIKDRFDVGLAKPTRQEDAFWRAFNRPSNFLKHADLDAHDTLSLDHVNNDYLILAASAAYRDLMGRLTPEMTAFGAYRFAYEWDGPERVLGVMISKLRSAKSAQRRKLCLQMIRDSRSERSLA